MRAESQQWRGATIIDAVVLARRAVMKGSPALATIVDKWGEKVLDEDGNLDRASLRNIVFETQSDLEELNEIVHPEVMRLRKLEIQQATDRGDQNVVCVIPLLFERKLADDFDCIILVDAPKDLPQDQTEAARTISTKPKR